MREKVDPTNPLVIFKDSHKLTWEDISDNTGIPLQSIYVFIRKNTKQLGLCQIRTAAILKKELNIDLIKAFNNKESYDKT